MCATFLKVQADTAEVRAGEELDAARLSAYLGEPVHVRQFPNGHSNLVYLIEAGGREFVLRRPPLGPVAPKAHDMAREYKVLRAVHPHFPEAPAVFRLCEDASIIGSVFFLMERRHGEVIRDHVPAGLLSVPDYPRVVSEVFIDCLVRLHGVDVSAPDLNALGRPEGFVERQVRGWADRWNRSRTDDQPEMDGVWAWLAANVPPSGAATLVHNDYKLDNVMLRSDGNRVEAVLDWEMATLGDPLADLGLTMCYWSCASVAAKDDPHPATPVITAEPGWYSRDEFLHRYAARTGRDVSHIGYYEVLGVAKLAVILQQIYYRFRMGQTQDERFRHFDARVRGLVSMAVHLMERKG